jgi:hypothetical protein
VSAAYRPRSKSRRRHGRGRRRLGPALTMSGFDAVLKDVWTPALSDHLRSHSTFLDGLSGTPGQKAVQRVSARRTFDQRIAEYRFFELPREQLLDMLEEMS